MRLASLIHFLLDHLVVSDRFFVHFLHTSLPACVSILLYPTERSFLETYSSGDVRILFRISCLPCASDGIHSGFWLHSSPWCTLSAHPFLCLGLSLSSTPLHTGLAPTSESLPLLPILIPFQPHPQSFCLYLTRRASSSSCSLQLQSYPFLNQAEALPSLQEYMRNWEVVGRKKITFGCVFFCSLTCILYVCNTYSVIL